MQSYLLAFEGIPLDFTQKESHAVKLFNETMAQFSSKIGVSSLTYPVILELSPDNVNPASKTDPEIKETYCQAIFCPTQVVVTGDTKLVGEWTIYRDIVRKQNYNEFLPKTHLIDFSNGKRIALYEEDKVLLFFLVFILPKCEILRDSFGNTILKNQLDRGQSCSYKIINEYQSIIDNSEMEEIITKAKNYLYGDKKMSTELLNAIALNYKINTENQVYKTIINQLDKILFNDYNNGNKTIGIEKINQFLTIVSDYDYLRMKMAVNKAIENQLIVLRGKEVGQYKAWFYTEKGEPTNLLCNMPMGITDDSQREDYVTKFLLEREKDRNDFYSFLNAHGVKISRIEVLADEKQEGEIKVNTQNSNRGRPPKVN